VGEVIQKTLESVKWLLWHGKVDKALARLRDLDQRINHFADSYLRFPQLKNAVQKFRTYLENNRRFLPNYGRRYRRGERISTAFVESTVNYVISKRFVKKQSMQWTKARGTFAPANARENPEQRVSFLPSVAGILISGRGPCSGCVIPDFFDALLPCS